MGSTTVSSSDLRINLADALDSVDRDNILIVTRRGKKDRAIVDIDKLEDLLAASDPKYLKTIKAARESDEYLTHEDVFGDI
jgi:prevent-host-death family protein